jgi:hypothetical protein
MQLPTFKSSSLLQYWVEPASRSVHLSEYGARFDYVQFYEAFEAIALLLSHGRITPRAQLNLRDWVS